MAFFSTVGNSWEQDDSPTNEVKWVYCTGVVLTLIPSFLLLFPKDSRSLDRISEGIKDINTSDDKLSNNNNTKWIKNSNIPIVLFSFDVVTSIGAGMTVKFFPLWMMNSLKLTPRE